MTEIKYIPACAVCSHDKRSEIDEKLLSGKFTQKELAVEYNVSEQSVSNHKNKHVLDSSQNIERLQLMVQRALAKNLEPDNIGELVRLLEYYDRIDARKCEKCEYRLNASLRSIEQALAEFLGMDGDYKDAPCWEYIHIIPDEYSAFAEFMKDEKRDMNILICPEAYKKFKEVIK